MDFIGTFDQDKAGHSEYYYRERGVILDFRGDLKISDLSYWGWLCRVFTQTHPIVSGEFDGHAVNRAVIVDDYAWIASCSILFDCHIEHHGIVSVGSVVNDLVVPPYHIAAGNPAKLVARWDGEKWKKIKQRY